MLRTLLPHLMLLLQELPAAARLLHAPVDQCSPPGRSSLSNYHCCSAATAVCFCLCCLCYSGFQKLLHVAFNNSRASGSQAFAAGSDAG
jgi:hypothetical protein